jgi:hypothetical protein
MEAIASKGKYGISIKTVSKRYHDTSIKVSVSPGIYDTGDTMIPTSINPKISITDKKHKNGI